MNTSPSDDGNYNYNQDCRDDFFNNILPITEFKNIISKENHSKTLTENTIIAADNKFRVVCLSKYDWYHLFISERSIDAYYDINNPKFIKHSYFRILEQNDSEQNDSEFKPFEYEYALYDGELLLKYDKRHFKLSLIPINEPNQSRKTEFDAAVRFFANHIKVATDKSRDNLGDLKNYLLIKEEVRRNKLEILQSIIGNNRLAHKLSYLYTGGAKWEEYVNKDTVKYKSFATKAVEDGIRHFFHPSDQNFNIIELGAGTGEKTVRVCDVLADSIESYTLLDISTQLLDKAYAKLNKHMPRLNTRKILLDCCLVGNRKTFRQAIAKRDVFILSNSTLLTETGFNWGNLKQARRIFITLDLLVETGSKEETLKNAFDDYIEAKELLLYPLKIFEIPLIFDENSDKLFCSSYDGTQPVFQMKFNLKKYFEDHKIVFGELGEFTEDNLISERLKREGDNKEGIRLLNSRIEEDKNKRVRGINEKRRQLNEDYISQRKLLMDIEGLVVLESLKFKYDKANRGQTEMEITNYFNDLGFSTELELFEYDNGNKTEAFAAILLTPR